MKNYIIYTLFLGMSFLSANAQVFESSKHYVSIGYGYGSSAQTMLRTTTPALTDDVDIKASFLGPVFLKYEYGIKDNYGIGINVAHTSGTINYNFNSIYTSDSSALLKEKGKWSSTTFLLRFNYHFAKGDRIDPYIGMGVGYRKDSWKVESNDPDPERDYLSSPSTSILVFSQKYAIDMTIGSRFMFTEKIGAYVEVGISKAVIQGGLTAKF